MPLLRGIFSSHLVDVLLFINGVEHFHQVATSQFALADATTSTAHEEKKGDSSDAGWVKSPAAWPGRCTVEHKTSDYLGSFDRRKLECINTAPHGRCGRGSQNGSRTKWLISRLRAPATFTLFGMYTIWTSVPHLQMFSPGIDDVKYSRGDCCRVLRVKIWVSFQKLQPWVVQKQLPDERLQVILHHTRTNIFRCREICG